MVRELAEGGRVAVLSFAEGVPLNLVGRILPKVVVVPPETAFPGARPLGAPSSISLFPSAASCPRSSSCRPRPPSRVRALHKR